MPKIVRMNFETTWASRKQFKRALRVLGKTAKEVFQKAMRDAEKEARV